jgi:hypothetical protein
VALAAPWNAEKVILPDVGALTLTAMSMSWQSWVKMTHTRAPCRAGSDSPERLTISILLPVRPERSREEAVRTVDPNRVGIVDRNLVLPISARTVKREERGETHARSLASGDVGGHVT